MKAASARVAAVLVTYHPDWEQVCRCLVLLAPQVDATVVVDNGAAPGGKAPECLRGRPAVQYLAADNQGGIGRAQNLGADLAFAAGADYVLFLDDDSLPPPQLVPALVRAGESLQGEGFRVAAVAPCHRDATAGMRLENASVRAGRVGRILVPEGERAPVAVLMASGMLVPRSAWADIGGMDERFIVAHVDTDWCLRAIAKGYGLWVDGSVELQHELGMRRIRFRFGRSYLIPINRSFRYYFYFRNSLILARRSYCSGPWRRCLRKGLLEMFFFLLLVHPDRLRTLAACAAGALAGWRGRLDRVPGFVAPRAVQEPR